MNIDRCIHVHASFCPVRRLIRRSQYGKDSTPTLRYCGTHYGYTGAADNPFRTNLSKIIPIVYPFTNLVITQVAYSNVNSHVTSRRMIDIGIGQHVSIKLNSGDWVGVKSKLLGIPRFHQDACHPPRHPTSR